MRGQFAPPLLRETDERASLRVVALSPDGQLMLAGGRYMFLPVVLCCVLLCCVVLFCFRVCQPQCTYIDVSRVPLLCFFHFLCCGVCVYPSIGRG